MTEYKKLRKKAEDRNKAEKQIIRKAKYQFEVDLAGEIKSN